MKPKKKQMGKPCSKGHMSSQEIAICYMATLILAGFIVQRGLDAPAVWGFLGVAIGLLFGKASGTHGS